MFLGDQTIPRAINARYECIDKEACFAGTRTDILSKIYHWIDLGDLTDHSVDVLNEPSDKVDTARIFWVNGPGSAGTGKSTIAYTVAQRCRERGILGASFFCSRDDAECSNPKLIFTTIVSQLASFHDQFKQELLKVLQSDPDIVYTGVSYQLNKLLVKPLEVVKATFPFCVVVLDALDECKDHHATSVVLSALAHHIAALSPIKFLITSRPEQNIIGGFKLANLAAVTQRLILHEVNSDVVEIDIYNYLAYRLNQIQEAYGLLDWPSNKDVLLLTHLSAGLFLFAATAAKFIEDQKYSNPQGQLACILQSPAFNGGSHNLDRLYMQVLSHAFPEISASLASGLRIVLGAIILLQEPLSPFDLQQLCHRLKISVRETLRHLHAVVIVPDDDTGVIHLIHPTFYQFLTDPGRCTNLQFLIKVEMHHSILVQACFDVMDKLTPDICQIGGLFKLNGDVQDLPARIKANIPFSLLYACRHWSYHLSSGLVSNEILKSLEKFATFKLLCWVEVCSLAGELHGALFALHTAQQLISVSHQVFTPSC
jgi:hypothetical protein